MKISSTAILLAVTLAFAAFIGGFYIGRNTAGHTVELSAGAAATRTDTTSPSAGNTATAASPTESKPLRININTATAAELQQLPSIGPRLAQRIVYYRNEFGPFQSVAQLTLVEGIAQGILDKIMDYITV